MLHDYHLYTCPAMIREARPDVFLHHFVHIPWTQPDTWRILPARMREEIFRGLLANDIIGFHTSAYCRNFLHCCRELMELEVDFDREAVVHSEPRDLGARLPAGDRRRDGSSGSPHPTRSLAYEEALLERRRDHLILRVDRADLSKNVLRGFTAFDTFLQQHPEFRERVTFIAHLAALAPGRPRVPGVPGADRGARRGRQPPPRHHRLDADRPADLRELPRGGRPLQAVRPADRQRAVRRHEPRRQGGARGQHPRRRGDALREHRRPRGARRLHPDRQPVRHPGAGRRDPPGADDVRRGALAARHPPARDRPRARPRRSGSTSSSPTSAPSARRRRRAAAATRPSRSRSPSASSDLPASNG